MCIDPRLRSLIGQCGIYQEMRRLFLSFLVTARDFWMSVYVRSGEEIDMKGYGRRGKKYYLFDINLK